MARHHDETDPRQHVYEVAYQAYQGGGYADVVDAVRPILAAEALRAFADANRFPSHWVMFRRADGYGVTVGDLLRERAAELEQEARDA